MKELKPGMTLTAGGRTWEILNIINGAVYVSAPERYIIPIELAAMLPWEEPVEEWLSENEFDAIRDEFGLYEAKPVNAMLTRKYGQPPKEVGK